MSDRFTLTIPGEPVAWARARRNGKRYFTDQRVTAHARRIQEAWMLAGRPSLGSQAVTISAYFYLPRPGSHYGTGRNATRLRKSAPGRPTCKPDVDNFVKLIGDALNELAWNDDAQIVCLSGIAKRYTAEGDQSRTVIEAWATL